MRPNTVCLPGRSPAGSVGAYDPGSAGCRRTGKRLPSPSRSKAGFMSSLRQAAIAREKWELILIWGGQIAPLLTFTKAADLMTALVADTNEYCRSVAGDLSRV